MNVKEKLKNDILVGMRMYLDVTTMVILETVIVKAVQNIEMTELETLPATIDDTNNYIIDLFMARKATKLSEKTVEAYMNTLREFIALINKPLNKVSECDIECYLYRKKQLNNNNTSLNNCRRNLSAIFTWMRKVKLIADNPCDGVEPFPKIEKPVDHLEATDVELIKKGCKYKRDRALVEFMRSTALRRGEIPQIKVKDIDFGTGKLVIYGHKTYKYRTVFLDKVALYYIKEYLTERGINEQSEEPLFTHLRGDKTQGLDAEGIYAAIKTIAKRSGIKRRVYPHLYRKTTATTMVKRGATEDLAGKYLGHAPKGVTGQNYIARSEQQVEQIFHSYVEAV